jgi:hypothetical protein
MSSQVDSNHLERLTEEAVAHLRVIRKYTAWIAFFVVLAGALALIAFFLALAGTVTTFG